MTYDIHCPYCGEFRHDDPIPIRDTLKLKAQCPRCGNRQAFSLYHREDFQTRADVAEIVRKNKFRE